MYLKSFLIGLYFGGLAVVLLIKMVFVRYGNQGSFADVFNGSSRGDTILSIVAYPIFVLIGLAVNSSLLIKRLWIRFCRRTVEKYG